MKIYRKWCLMTIFCLGFSLYGNENELQEEVESLQQRISELEAKVSSDQAQSKEKHPSLETSDEKILETIYDDGFQFIAHDDTMIIGGWSQIDYRFFEAHHPGNSQFLIRRARLFFQGILEDIFAYKLFGAFEGSRAKLQEAWIEYKQFPCARIRVGQFKEPFSLEALYSARWIHFVERGIGPTNLAPFEDIGIQLFGSIVNDKVIYAVGAFNGEGKNVNDTDDSEDIVGRVTFQPYRDCACSLFETLYLGGSFTTGYHHSSALDGKSYRTALRTPFVTFADDVSQSGNLTRWGAEVEWFYRSFWLCGEYIFSRHKGVKLNAVQENVESNSWYVMTTYLLTGEHQRHSKPVVPCTNFDPCKCGWGAWELGVRYEEFRTNSKAFTTGLVTGTRKVHVVTGGLIWWPNWHTKFMANFIHTKFHENIFVSGKRLRHEKWICPKGSVCLLNRQSDGSFSVDSSALSFQSYLHPRE